MKELTDYELELENFLKGNNQFLFNLDNGFLEWLINFTKLEKLKMEFYWKFLNFIVNFC